MKQLTRRAVLEKCCVRGLLIAGAPMCGSKLVTLWAETESLARKITHVNVMGPFYKKGAPDNPVLRGPNDPGIPLQVSGRIVNTRGEAVQDARIEVWQADHDGHYDVKGYRYRAKLSVDSAAGYKFETVMPGHYPDRVAQHIHYIISAPGHKPLVTQLYFATDPVFEGDPDKNFGKDPLVESRELIRPVTLFEKPAAPHAAVVFEVCIERA